MDAGFNPLNWNCEKKGCFNVLRRPKIEVFAGCFPRRVNFGDVDGLVELGGKFCLLEWKGPGGSLRDGQRISLQRFSAFEGNLALVVEGDAQTMEVQRIGRFFGGTWRDWREANLDDVKETLRHWASFADERVAA